MINVLPLLVISSGSVYGATFLDKKYEEFLPITIFAIILILYFTYIMNVLSIGFGIIVFISLILYALSIYKNVKYKTYSKTFHNLFTPGFLCFIVLFIVLLFITKNNFVSLWDELRLWGAYPKLLFFDEKVQITNNSMMYDTMRSYLPGMPLFQYFWMKCIGSFVESYLFLSYSVVYISLLLPLLKKLKWEKAWKLLFIIPFIILIPLTFYNSGFDFGYYYLTLFIDPILGICFGCSMFLSFNNVFKDKWDYIGFLLLTCVLILFKDSGFLFSIMAIITAIINDLIIEKSKVNIKKYVVMIVIPIAVLISWKIFVSSNGISNLLANPINLNSIINFITNPSLEQVDVFKRFSNNLINLPIVKSLVFTKNIKLSFAFFIVLFSIFGLLINSKINDKQRKNYQISLISIFATTFLFIIGLLLLSTITFNNIYSFGRYVNTVMIGIYTYFSMILIKNFTINKDFNKIIIIFIILSILIFPLDKKKYDNYLNYSHTHSLYSEAKISNSVVSNERVNVFVFGNSYVSDNALLHHQIYFRLIDKNIFVKNFYTETYPEEKFDLNSWLEYLKENEYQYVYFMNLEQDKFTDELIKLTDCSKIIDDDLFQIIYDNDKITFKKI